MSRRHRGMIARLPYEVRSEVCRRLRDGQTYAAVAEYARGAGYPDIDERHVERWAKPDSETGRCGYNDWLRDQDRLDDMASKREFALQIVRANEGSTIHEAALQVAASQLYEVITEFNLDNIKQQLAEKPKLYADLVGSLGKLSHAGLEYAKYRDHVVEQKRKITQLTSAAAKAPGGLTPETLKQIEEAAALL